MSRKLFLIALAFAAMLSVSCNCEKKQAALEPEHLVFIGIDGMSAISFEEGEMPFVKSLLEQSSYTVKKRSVLPSSSAVNWASMFMGAAPELHGYTEWGSKVPELPSRVILKNGIFPTFFQLYRDKYPEAEMGAFYEWEGIKYLIDTLSFNVYAKPDFGESCDLVSLTKISCEYLAEKQPAVAAILFDCPDHQGHAEGWRSPLYMETLTRIDACVEQIFKTVEEAGYLDNTVFVITADHGGIDKGHGGKTMDEMETPFIVLGKGIKKNFCFDDISMMQYDVAATMAAICGVEQPQVWVGRPVKEIFE